jgi:hypothetical protein
LAANVRGEYIQRREEKFFSFQFFMIGTIINTVKIFFVETTSFSEELFLGIDDR